MPYIRETRSYVFTLIVIACAFFLGAYGLFEARHLIQGPAIMLETPHDGVLAEDELVTVSGNTRNISNITLNDRPIFIDENGHFSEQLVLPEGYTIMTLRAEDRFGRETIERIELVYSGSEN